MAATSITMKRARRVARIFDEVKGQTGSNWSALIYTGRYVLAKLPYLWRRARRFGRPARNLRAGVAREMANLPPDTAYVAVLATGGLGDYIIVARFMRDLAAQCGPLAFDVFANNPVLAKWVFAAVDGVRTVREELHYDAGRAAYDLALRASQIVIVDDVSPVPRQPALRKACAEIGRNASSLMPFVERHPYWDNFLAQTLVFANRTRSGAMQDIAGLPYGGDRLPIAADNDVLARHGLTPGSYVTLHNGFDPQFFVTSNRATKCYPHFGQVVHLLKQTMPHLRIVQLGTSTSDPVEEADLNLIGATTLREAAALVANARLHVDNEGGLVHLARCYGVQSCVVFGPTPANYFGYAGNINIAPPVCGGCWWITETWMDTCPRGYETPRCLSEQDPQNVADAILRVLAPAPGQA